MLGTTRILSFTAAFLVYFCITVYPVTAQTLPTFSSCINPTGTIIAQYLSGTHGIAGVNETKVGSDIVYRLTADTVLQCFCTSDGQGIQTNWWRVADLTKSEIDGFVALGWIYVPDGSLWGLDASPYIVKNLNYLCIGGLGGGEVSSSTTTSVSTSSSSGSSGGGGGIGSVLGLAWTGSLVSILTLFTVGLLFIALGLFPKRKKV